MGDQGQKDDDRAATAEVLLLYAYINSCSFIV